MLEQSVRRITQQWNRLFCVFSGNSTRPRSSRRWYPAVRISTRNCCPVGFVGCWGWYQVLSVFIEFKKRRRWWLVWALCSVCSWRESSTTLYNNHINYSFHRSVNVRVQLAVSRPNDMSWCQSRIGKHSNTPMERRFPPGSCVRTRPLWGHRVYAISGPDQVLVRCWRRPYTAMESWKRLHIGRECHVSHRCGLLLHHDGKSSPPAAIS